jgi:ribosomal protein L24E
MSIEDTIGCGNETPTCVVCGKGVDHGGGFARVNHNGIMVNLCCPLCMEAFEKDPKTYMLRLGKVLRYRSLHGTSNE